VGKIEHCPSIGSVALTGGSCIQQNGSSGGILAPCKSLAFGSCRASIPNRGPPIKAYAQSSRQIDGGASPRPGHYATLCPPAFWSSADLDPGSNAQASLAWDILLYLRARVGGTIKEYRYFSDSTTSERTTSYDCTSPRKTSRRRASTQTPR
jgi:hypothetical protein